MCINTKGTQRKGKGGLLVRLNRQCVWGCVGIRNLCWRPKWMKYQVTLSETSSIYLCLCSTPHYTTIFFQVSKTLGYRLSRFSLTIKPLPVSHIPVSCLRSSKKVELLRSIVSLSSRLSYTIICLPILNQKSHLDIRNLGLWGEVITVVIC